MNYVECPKCKGDSYIEVEVPGGRLDSAMQQWYPEFELAVCPTCNGRGEVEDAKDE